MNKNEVLNELIGFLQVGKGIQPVQPLPQGFGINNKYISTRPPSFVGAPVRYCTGMKPYQNSTTQLLKDGKDVYVVAKPSAGKTMPIICYWASQCLGVNPDADLTSGQDYAKIRLNLLKILFTPEKIPKMLYLAPIVNLSIRTVAELVEDFYKIISHTIEMIIRRVFFSHSILLDKSLFNPKDTGQQHYDNIDITNKIAYKLQPYSKSKQLNNYIKTRLSLYDEIQKRKNTLNTTNLGYDVIEMKKKELLILYDKIKNIDNLIDSELQYAIKNFIQSELISLRTGPEKSSTDISQTPVTVCTYQSGEGVFRQGGFGKMNPANGGVKLVVCDESHLIQKLSDDRVQPGSYETQAEQIAKNVYYIVKNISLDTRLVFLSGTVHPKSADSLAEYLNSCFKRQIQVLKDIPEQNPAILNYIPSDWLRDKDEILRRLIINPQTTHNLIIVFSKNAIMNYIEAAINLKGNTGRNLSSIDKGVGEPFQFGSTMKFTGIKPDDDFDNTKFDYTNKGNMWLPHQRSDKFDPGFKASNIYFPLQRAAVAIGVGFIFRMDTKIPGFKEEDTQKYQNDFAIVADLFAKGQIKTILASDAVGIGVNMTVQNMYIPSVSKPTSLGTYENIKISDFSQLLNRSGRAAFKYANIYAPESDIPHVQAALNAGIEDFEQRITIRGANKNICDGVEWIKTIYNTLTS